MATAVSKGVPEVVGTLDSGLRIERISSEARILFDLPVDVLIGESLLALVIWEDVPSYLAAYAEAAASQRGVKVNLSFSGITGGRSSEPLLCELLITPLPPSSDYAFVVRPARPAALDLLGAEPMTVLPDRAGRGPQPALPAPGGLLGVLDAEVPGIGRLTTREQQIVSRLLEGHRPPSIARALFLSQSTVRNHLASVFRKLGVASQEGLLELFRAAPSAAGAQRTAFVDDDRVLRIS
ncbi:helix-turn-helix domain-containing protein [Knoellia sp. CPCC 206453]|uniref:helix-turn-helix domain-containing protein n=1 Tax=Knoellia pratensis TaxID=3404796 RepID=UPI0036166EBC